MTLRTLVLAMAVAVAGGAHATESGAPASPAASRASSPAIPFKRETESTADLSGRLALALLACVAAGAGGIHLLRKRWAPSLGGFRGRRLQLLEVQRIGVKSSVVLLRWDQEELLLSQSDGQMQLLARRNVPVDAQREPGERP